MSGALSYVGQANGENGEVSINVIDNQNFEVCISMYVTQDYQSYLSNAAINNSTAFTNGNLPNTTDLGIAIEVGSETVICSVPLSLNSICEGSNLTFNYDGYYVGQDLDVFINSPDATSSQFYFGFYDESAITNGSGLVDDLGLDYLTSGNSGGCVKSSQGFQYQTRQNTGIVTIDGSCLVEGGCYRLYVVYQDDGQWKSCISEPIKQAPNPRVICGDVTYCLTDALGVEHNSSTGNFAGVSTCGTVTLCVKMDAASYDQMLSDNGLNGDMLSNFVNGYVDQYPAIVDDQVISVCAEITPNGAGSVSANFAFVFNVEGCEQVINVPTQIDFVDNLNFEDTSGLGDVICAEDEEIITIPISSGEAFLTVDGQVVDSQALTVSGGVASIDTSLIQTGVCYCLKVVGDSDPIEDECECDPCPIYEIEIGKEVDEDGFANLTIESVGSVLVNGFEDGVPFFGSTGSFYGADPGETIEITYIQLTKDNGCVYEFNGSVKINAPSTPPGQSNGIIISTVPTTLITPNQSGCECDEEVECDNNAWINYECDRETETVTLTFNSQFSEAPIVDTQEVSYDGGATWQAASGTITGESNISVRWLLEFENCDPITVTDTIVCLPFTECVNTRTIDCDPTTGAITLNDSFDSGILSDVLEISFDFGNTWTTYDPSSSYTPDPFESDAIIRTITKFDDGCEDLNVTVSCPLEDDNNSAECDYSAYSLTAECDQENCLATPQFNGDVSDLILDERLFCINGGKETPLQQDSLSGYGSYVFIWNLQKAGCEPITLTYQCFIKQEIELGDVNLETGDINLDLTDLVNVLTDIKNELDCLDVEIKNMPDFESLLECINVVIKEDEEPCPTGSAQIDCTDCDLTMNIVDYAGYSWELSYPDGTTIAVTPQEVVTVVDEGLYTLTGTLEGCDTIITDYEHDVPNAGEDTQLQIDI